MADRVERAEEEAWEQALVRVWIFPHFLILSGGLFCLMSSC